MTEKLVKFLEDNVSLLDVNDMLTLFNECPYYLREELLNFLDEQEIEIELHDGVEYCLMRKSQVYSITKFKNNVYMGDFELPTDEDVTDQIVMFPTLRHAIHYCMHFVGKITPLKSSFTDEYDWIRVTGLYGEIAVTQKCIDNYDPKKQRERKIVFAARDELEAEIARYTQKVFTKNVCEKIEKKVNEYLQVDSNIASMRVYTDVRLTCYGKKFDAQQASDIAEIVQSNVQVPLDIKFDTKNEDRFTIKIIGKQIDKIRDKVSELFGVGL